jgi:hypothetical protein
MITTTQPEINTTRPPASTSRRNSNPTGPLPTSHPADNVNVYLQ